MQKLISWVEIPATNIERAVDFYNSVFKLELKIIDCGSEKMACFPNNEGAISQSPNFNPSKEGTLVSLNTNNELDSVIQRVKEKNGNIIQPKTKIESDSLGHFALFIDSEGNKVGLYGN